MDLATRQSNMRSLSCPICQKLFRQVTIIEDCCHRFCYKCITKKITEEGLRSCPVCHVDLGCAPLQRLRIDSGWQSIMDNFNERKREHIECGLLKETTKTCQGLGQEMKRSDLNQSKERALYPANMQMPEASLSTHEKQKYVAGRLKYKQYFQKNERDRPSICTKAYPMEHVQGQRAKESFHNTEDAVPFTSLVVDEYGNSTECNDKVKTFWFSLVASNNQKSKEPLEQIPSRYLRVKDANITVSSIQKYLMQRLNLRSENEVEISLQGRLLLPSLQIWKLVDLWLLTSEATERKRAFLGCSAHDFILTLTYARRPVYLNHGRV